jgi:hypothetical protein
MILLAQGGPPGPDLCYLLGFCQTSSGVTSNTNLFFLTAVLIVAAVVVRRSRRPPGK